MRVLQVCNAADETSEGRYPVRVSRSDFLQCHRQINSFSASEAPHLLVDHSLTTLETSAVSGTILTWIRRPLSGRYSKMLRGSLITSLEEPQPTALRRWT